MVGCVGQQTPVERMRVFGGSAERAMEQRASADGKLEVRSCVGTLGGWWWAVVEVLVLVGWAFGGLAGIADYERLSWRGRGSAGSVRNDEDKLRK